MRKTQLRLLAAGAFLALLPTLAAMCQEAGPLVASAPTSTRSDYVLGPDDEVSIRALDAEEIANQPVRIDGAGYINLPMIGRVKASGLTVQALEAELKTRLSQYVLRPDISLVITSYRSQPVSVLGSVNKPGSVQLEGHKTLIEVLTLAGGLSADAGNTLKITRRTEWGKLPLPNATADPSGAFSIAEINLRSLLEARRPEENILIMPNDVLSVPRGQMVYVIGEVKKAGGFVLADRDFTTVLQAVAMAQGLEPTAKGTKARIIRPVADAAPQEIAINISAIMAGKQKDVLLKPDDILFIPTSYAKSTWRRTLETTIQMATGVAIYRGW